MFGSSRVAVISTPIFYVNGSGHLGHMYTLSLSDSYCRFLSLCGKKTYLITGTDEHGQKIFEAASKSSKENKGMEHVRKFVDEVSAGFRRTADGLNVKYADFVRTTEPRHIDRVRDMWKTLAAAGAIRNGTHSGWYSVPDETFVPDNQINTTSDGLKMSAESGHLLNWVEEPTHVFDLERFRKQITAWATKTESITPNTRRNEVLASLKEPLQSLSISRPRSRVAWGIPVPGEEEKATIYVWLDALTNYLTALKPTGKPDAPEISNVDFVHIIGKDILRFHTVFWPAFLAAAGLPLPHRVVVHSHWKVNGVKMSKSLGNVVSAEDLLARYSSDTVRYFLLRDSALENDMDFSEKHAIAVYNAELADTLGNLLMRATSAKILGALPDGARTNLADLSKEDAAQFVDLAELRKSVIMRAKSGYERFNFSETIIAVMDLARAMNQIFTVREPWKLARNPEHRKLLSHLIAVTLAVVRTATVLLSPIVPSASQSVLLQLEGLSHGSPRAKYDLTHANNIDAFDQLLAEDINHADNVRYVIGATPVSVPFRKLLPPDSPAPAKA